MESLSSHRGTHVSVVLAAWCIPAPEDIGDTQVSVKQVNIAFRGRK